MHASGDVDASATSGAGFIARNETSGVVENCYATGNVNSYVYAGGFASENAGKISKETLAKVKKAMKLDY